MAAQLRIVPVTNFSKWLILLMGCYCYSCHIGWTSLNNKKYQEKTEKKQFNQLPSGVQNYIKQIVKTEKYHAAFSHDSDLPIKDYYLVSADYSGVPFKKMGHYIQISEKKYFLEYKKGEPIIIYDGVLYYTNSLNLGKGINQGDDWLDQELFFCVKIK